MFQKHFLIVVFIVVIFVASANFVYSQSTNSTNNTTNNTTAASMNITNATNASTATTSTSSPSTSSSLTTTTTSTDTIVIELKPASTKAPPLSPEEFKKLLAVVLNPADFNPTVTLAIPKGERFVWKSNYVAFKAGDFDIDMLMSSTNTKRINSKNDLNTVLVTPFASTTSPSALVDIAGKNFTVRMCSSAMSLDTASFFCKKIALKHSNSQNQQQKKMGYSGASFYSTKYFLPPNESSVQHTLKQNSFVNISCPSPVLYSRSPNHFMDVTEKRALEKHCYIYDPVHGTGFSKNTASTSPASDVKCDSDHLVSLDCSDKTNFEFSFESERSSTSSGILYAKPILVETEPANSSSSSSSNATTPSSSSTKGTVCSKLWNVDNFVTAAYDASDSFLHRSNGIVYPSGSGVAYITSGTPKYQKRHNGTSAAKRICAQMGKDFEFADYTTYEFTQTMKKLNFLKNKNKNMHLAAARCFNTIWLSKKYHNNTTNNSSNNNNNNHTDFSSDCEFAQNAFPEWCSGEDRSKDVVLLCQNKKKFTLRITSPNEKSLLQVREQQSSSSTTSSSSWKYVCYQKTFYSKLYSSWNNPETFSSKFSQQLCYSIGLPYYNSFIVPDQSINTTSDVDNNKEEFEIANVRPNLLFPTLTNNNNNVTSSPSSVFNDYMDFRQSNYSCDPSKHGLQLFCEAKKNYELRISPHSEYNLLQIREKQVLPVGSTSNDNKWRYVCDSSSYYHSEYIARAWSISMCSLLNLPNTDTLAVGNRSILHDFNNNNNVDDSLPEFEISSLSIPLDVSTKGWDFFQHANYRQRNMSQRTCNTRMNGISLYCFNKIPIDIKIDRKTGLLLAKRQQTSSSSVNQQQQQQQQEQPPLLPSQQQSSDSGYSPICVQQGGNNPSYYYGTSGHSLEYRRMLRKLVSFFTNDSYYFRSPLLTHFHASSFSAETKNRLFASSSSSSSSISSSIFVNTILVPLHCSNFSYNTTFYESCGYTSVFLNNPYYNYNKYDKSTSLVDIFANCSYFAGIADECANCARETGKGWCENNNNNNADSPTGACDAGTSAAADSGSCSSNNDPSAYRFYCWQCCDASPKKDCQAFPDSYSPDFGGIHALALLTFSIMFFGNVIIIILVKREFFEKPLFGKETWRESKRVIFIVNFVVVGAYEIIVVIRSLIFLSFQGGLSKRCGGKELQTILTYCDIHIDNKTPEPYLALATIVLFIAVQIVVGNRQIDALDEKKDQKDEDDAKKVPDEELKIKYGLTTKTEIDDHRGWIKKMKEENKWSARLEKAKAVVLSLLLGASLGPAGSLIQQVSLSDDICFQVSETFNVYHDDPIIFAQSGVFLIVGFCVIVVFLVIYGLAEFWYYFLAEKSEKSYAKAENRKLADSIQEKAKYLLFLFLIVGGCWNYFFTISDLVELAKLGFDMQWKFQLSQFFAIPLFSISAPMFNIVIRYLSFSSSSVSTVVASSATKAALVASGSSSSSSRNILNASASSAKKKVSEIADKLPNISDLEAGMLVKIAGKLHEQEQDDAIELLEKKDKEERLKEMKIERERAEQRKARANAPTSADARSNSSSSDDGNDNNNNNSQNKPNHNPSFHFDDL